MHLNIIDGRFARGFDIFSNLAHFIKNNGNLHYIEINGATSPMFESLALVLSKGKNITLQQIRVSGGDCADEQAALFFDALNGCYRLSEICFNNSHIGTMGCTELASC